LTYLSLVKTKRKPKKFAPREIEIKGRKLWQIYLGSEVKERNGRQVRIPNRKTFASRSEALEYAELLRIQRINHGVAAMGISAATRAQAVEAEQLLAPFGVSIQEVVKEYVSRQAAVKKSLEASAAVEAYISAAIADGRRPRYVQDLRSRLGRFGQNFAGRTLAEIDTQQLEDWLRGLGVGGVSRNTVRKRLVSLYSYGVDRGWCPANPAAKITVAREHPGPIGILTPGEFASLLGNASEQTLPYFAIGGFGGIRTAELQRLEWKDVHFDSKLIEISASKAKTAAKRFVKILPALEKWLEPYRNHRGLIVPQNGLKKLLLADRKRAGINHWPSNALRHSFASYHLAHFRNAAETSLEMGHMSPHLVFKHYRELVRPEEAEKWWTIVPVDGTKVVAM
jgi:integrase